MLIGLLYEIKITLHYIYKDKPYKNYRSSKWLPGYQNVFVVRNISSFRMGEESWRTSSNSPPQSGMVRLFSQSTASKVTWFRTDMPPLLFSYSIFVKIMKFVALKIKTGFTNLLFIYKGFLVEEVRMLHSFTVF